jgi:GTP cyclohydrolase II
MPAQELMNVMQQHSGVEFYLRDGGTERKGPVRVNFGRLIARDTLIANQPRSLDSDLRFIAWIDEVLDGIVGRLLL